MGVGAILAIAHSEWANTRFAPTKRVLSPSSSPLAREASKHYRLSHMNSEHGPNASPETAEDLDNEEVVYRILESGSNEEMARLQKHMYERTKGTMTPEQFELYRELARQRRRLINQSHAETEAREINLPKASENEYAIGAYKERLETQAREAVLSLRKKGYASFESGFSGLSRQQISFEQAVPELAEFKWSDSTLKEFHENAAEPYVQTKNIGFKTSRLLSDQTLTHLFDILVNELPVLEHPQPPTEVETAEFFRMKQDERFPGSETGG